MKTPLVSICLPNLNTQPFLEERMETILFQTFKDWELVICDSYSSDGSWEFFQKFRDDPRITMFQAPRAGTPGSWNYCVERSKGRYIYVATSDDTMEPNLLEVLLGALECAPQCLMATCNSRLIDEKSRPVTADVFGIDWRPSVYGDWMQRKHIRHGISEFVANCAAGTYWGTITAVLLKRNLLDVTGRFPIGKTSHADYEWGLRACLSTDTLHVPDCLATLRVHQSQSSANIDWAKLGFLHVHMIRDAMKDLANRIPAVMLTPEAFNKLTLPVRIRAFNALHLYPSTFLEHPVHTCINLGRGLKRQPCLTLSHLLQGARWDSRPQIDYKAHVESLLHEFGLPPICAPIEVFSQPTNQTGVHS